MPTLFLILAPLFSVATDAKEPAPALPAVWYGTWSGMLVIHGIAGKPTQTAMSLKIEPIKESLDYEFVIIYGDGDKKSVRNYKLLKGDKPGQLKIDERNGIVLDARLVNNVLYSQFEVSGQMLTARYELRGDTLRFEIASAKAATEKTGNGKVQGYVITAVQNAELRKK